MSELTSSSPEASELAFEASLRPQTLSEFIGQESIRKQISLILDAAKMQDRVSDHILLAG
ncbi:MAG: hypothetical protein RLZZ279_792, partial [Actinomycetota bacterium]